MTTIRGMFEMWSIMHPGRDFPLDLLDTWDDDDDAYLASVQNLARGGRGVWYSEQDSTRITAEAAANDLLKEEEEQHGTDH